MENKKALEVAKKMLTKGRPLEEAIDITGLTKEDVQGLEQTLTLSLSVFLGKNSE